MIDADGLVAVVLLMFWIWALLDCIATDSALCRNLPKPMWIVLVLILPDIGALAWLLLGRPEKANWRPGSTDYTKPRRPVGLEDSPRYSSDPIISDRRSEELNLELERWEKEQRERNALPAATAPASTPAAKDGPAVPADLDAWQQQLDQREAEIRRRELEVRQRELDQRELEQRERDLDQ